MRPNRGDERPYPPRQGAGLQHCIKSGLIPRRVGDNNETIDLPSCSSCLGMYRRSQFHARSGDDDST